MLMHIAVWPHASRGEELQTDSTCVRNLCILQRAQGWFEKHQTCIKKGTNYDLRPDLCPERLVSVGHRHLLCVSFSVDVRTLAPVVSLLLGCWSGGSPSLMTVVSSQLVRSQGNEMNRKSGQHHCNSALSICWSVMFLKSVHRCSSPSTVSILQWTPQISSSNKSNCMHAIECNWSVWVGLHTFSLRSLSQCWINAVTQEWNWRPREYDQPFFDGEPGALKMELDTCSVCMKFAFAKQLSASLNRRFLMEKPWKSCYTVCQLLDFSWALWACENSLGKAYLTLDTY